MGLCLILPGEIQVNIGRLFIAREAQEGLKRNIETVAPQGRAADRAGFFRHVGAAAVSGRFSVEQRRGQLRFPTGTGMGIPAEFHRRKLRVLALRADIVRRQRVDFGNPAHPRNHGRTDAAPASDQIAVVERILHQFLRAHVDHIIVVIENRVQFGVDAFLYQWRRDFSVHPAHSAVDQFFQFLGRVLDLWRKQAFRQELYLLDPVRNGAGIGDDHLPGGLLAQVLEFRQHLFRIAEVDRAVPVGIRKLFGCLQDAAVLLVLRIEEVHIRGRNDGFVQFPSDAQDRTVEVLQHLFPAHPAIVDQKTVVAKRLNLKIIIQGCDLPKFFIALAAHDGAVQFAHAAGRADQQPLAVLFQQALRNVRRTVKVFQIGLRDQFVQVLQTLPVLYQQDHVIGLVRMRAFRTEAVDVAQRPDAAVLHHGDELLHDSCDNRGIVACAMMVELRQLQVVRNRIEFKALQIGKQIVGSRERVVILGIEIQPVPRGRRLHESYVKLGVVRCQRPVSRKAQKGFQGFFFAGCRSNVGIGDAGQVRDFLRDRHSRVDKGLKAVQNLSVRNDHRADFGHAVRAFVEAGRFNIDGREFRLRRQIGAAVEDLVLRLKVCFHPVDDLDAVFFPVLPHVRESLGHSVVGHRNGRHPPVGSPFEECLRLGQRVKRGKTGVHMQLYALLGRVVRAHGLSALDDAARVKHHVVVKFGIADFSLHGQMIAFMNLVQNALVILRAQIAGNAYAVRPVGHIEGQHRSAPLLQGAA